MIGFFPNGVRLPGGKFPEPFEPDNLVRPDKINQILFARAWLDGYTVVKEPLYEVRLPFEQWDEDSAEVETEFAVLAYDITSGETKFVSSGTKFFSNNHVTKISEERIKLIDERYWAFAVPVEEEEK